MKKPLCFAGVAVGFTLLASYLLAPMLGMLGHNCLNPAIHSPGYVAQLRSDAARMAIQPRR